jgi:ABC-2 type transport system permease protein
MIPTLLRISRINLRRDRVAQMMVFILPIAFFSIFAMVFGRQSMSSTSRIEVVVVDEDGSERSRQLVLALKDEPTLRARDSVPAPGADARAARVPATRARATELVRGGDYAVALVIPSGWGTTFPSFGGGGTKTEVLADPSDPVAKNVFIGVLQRCGARVMRGDFASKAPGATDGGNAGNAGLDELALVRTRVTDVLGDQTRRGAMISFYAAGIAVMFLLFSASAAGGALLEEQDSGTLERVLNTNVGMSGLLAGKWLHLTLLGLAQITVMFLWGMLVFGLDLLGHLPGFAVMTFFTAAAAAGFGLLLATACRTRQQLGGFSTIIILTMSALGGSMFPRFLMSEGMQKVGLVTFNAWALDGYLKVFWREAPLIALWPQVLVLAGLTAAFLGVARTLARRWETV